MSVDAQGDDAQREGTQPAEPERRSARGSAAKPAHDAALRVDADVRRVLVFRLGSLGDTLVALPSFHLIEQAFPKAERRLLTNIPVTSRAPAAAAVLGDSGLIHRYESYPVGTRNPLRLLALLLRLRRFRPEVAIYLKAETNAQRSLRDRRFLRLTGARRIVGVAAGSETEAHRMPDGSWEPEVERLLRSLADLGSMDAGSRAAWDLRLTNAERDRADAVRAPLRERPFFAASIGTKVQAKDWGVRNWAELLREVAKQHPGYGLLLAGAPEERESSETVAAAWRDVAEAGPALNVCGALSPRETAAAFSNARAFLGHDSGPMHLAAAMGVPVIAVFSARNQPRTWFPYGTPSRVLYHRVDCWGCGLETCIAQRKKCLLSITVPEVLTALHDLLEGAA
ncbi:glycosyltransferase family 9 protein [Terriglobus sp.]|uniref:glycosyltransferase family 9 protein n=1 Tax=Terriglobus sp. TaxID=1889013 RepID=UPI003B003A49